DELEPAIVHHDRITSSMGRDDRPHAALRGRRPPAADAEPAERAETISTRRTRSARRLLTEYLVISAISAFPSVSASPLPRRCLACQGSGRGHTVAHGPRHRQPPSPGPLPSTPAAVGEPALARPGVIAAPVLIREI